MGPRDRCSIYGCLSNSLDHKGIRFFDFPPPGCRMYKLWLEKSPKSEEIIKTRSRPIVCAKHFDMKIPPYKRLDPEAVPTLFLEPTPEFLEGERLRKEQEAKETRMRQLLEDVVLEWTKRAKHCPDIGDNCTSRTEIYQIANRVRNLLGANLYFRTEAYWLRKFRDKHMAQFAQIDPASAKKSVDLRDIIQDLAPEVKILSEEEIAALREKEGKVLLETQKKKDILRKRRQLSVEAQQAEEARRARIRKLIDEIVLEWIKRAKHYKKTANVCTTRNEAFRVANRTRELLGANSYFNVGIYWMRKFRATNILQIKQKDPTAANKSLELRDIIKELAPDVKILSEEEIVVLQKKEADKETKKTDRQKRKAEESEVGLRRKRRKSDYGQSDTNENSSASSDSYEFGSGDTGGDTERNMDDCDNSVDNVGGSFKEAEQIVKQELIIEADQHQDSEEIPLGVASDAGQVSDTLGDDITKLCEKIKSEVSDSIEVHLIEYDSDTEDDVNDNGNEAEPVVKEEPLSDSPEQVSEHLEGVRVRKKIKSEVSDSTQVHSIDENSDPAGNTVKIYKETDQIVKKEPESDSPEQASEPLEDFKVRETIKSELSDSIEVYLVDENSDTEDDMGDNCKEADQIVKEEPLTDSSNPAPGPLEGVKVCEMIKSEDSGSIEVHRVSDGLDTKEALGNNCKEAGQMTKDEPLVKSCEEALEYMKPLEDFALQRENYRLIGVLTAIEKLLTDLKKTLAT